MLPTKEVFLPKNGTQTEYYIQRKMTLLNNASTHYYRKNTCGVTVVLLHCGCLSLNPFIEISIQNNSSSSDVLNIQASISISPKYETK